MEEEDEVRQVSKEGASVPVEDAPAASKSIPTDKVQSSAPLAKSADEEDAPPGLDPQLIALCAVLWVVACVIFFFQWDQMRIDWYLGNIKETLSAGRGLDEPSIAKLAELSEDMEVLEHLRQELGNRQLTSQNQQRYRVAIVWVVERIGGPKAFGLLMDTSRDYDPRVRANAYLALRKLATSGAQRAEVMQRAREASEAEREPVARVTAERVLGELGGSQAAWPLIRSLRDSDGRGSKIVRAAALKALRTIAGEKADSMPFDVEAELDVRNAQIESWESWFKGAGGTIPAGESTQERRAASESPTSVPAKTYNESLDPDNQSGKDNATAAERANSE